MDVQNLLDRLSSDDRNQMDDLMTMLQELGVDRFSITMHDRFFLLEGHKGTTRVAASAGDFNRTVELYLERSMKIGPANAA